MKSAAAHACIGIVVLSTLVVWYALHRQTQAQHSLKQRLQHLAHRGATDSFESGFSYLVIDREGIVTGGSRSDLLQHNMLADGSDLTTQAFKKLRARATSGGGFAVFPWVNDRDDLVTHVAYAVMRDHHLHVYMHVSVCE